MIRMSWVIVKYHVFMDNLDLMNFLLVLGTLKHSRFFFNSSSFIDRDPVMKLTCSTFQPWCYIVFLTSDLKDTYVQRFLGQP